METVLVMNKMKTYNLSNFLKDNTTFFKYIPFSHVTFIKGIDSVHLNMIKKEYEEKEFATRTLIQKYCTKTFTAAEAIDYLKKHDQTLELSIHWFNFYNEHILNVTSINLANVLFKAKLEQEVNKALESYNWE